MSGERIEVEVVETWRTGFAGAYEHPVVRRLPLAPGSLSEAKMRVADKAIAKQEAVEKAGKFSTAHAEASEALFTAIAAYRAAASREADRGGAEP